MPDILKKEGALLSHMAAKNAHIIGVLEDSWQYIAVPNGDRRRRPVAWISAHTLQRLLTIGLVVQNGNAYILTNTNQV